MNGNGQSLMRFIVLILQNKLLQMWTHLLHRLNTYARKNEEKLKLISLRIYGRGLQMAKKKKLTLPKIKMPKQIRVPKATAPKIGKVKKPRKVKQCLIKV